MNRQLRVNGLPGVETSIELLAHTRGGWQARMVSVTDERVRESCEFLSDELLESCLRTGYVSEAKPRGVLSV